MEYSWTLYILFATIVSFAATALSMPVLLQMCRSHGFYDVPNERKIHRNNIPRLGGLLFIPCTLIAITITIYLMSDGRRSSLFSSVSVTTFMIVTGMFLTYLIGLLDDLFGLSAGLKFGIQFVVMCFLPINGIYIHNLYGLLGLYELPLWVSYALTVFISLLIVNAINLIDGIDGLASTLSVMALATLGLLFKSQGMQFYSIYCFALVGTVAAFWMFNMFGNEKKGTKTFMGDTGSLTLGFSLTFLSIRYMIIDDVSTGFCEDILPILVPFTLLVVPCFDLVRVATMRIVHGKPIFHPDKTHIHHKCLRAGFTMHASLCIIVLLQILYMLVNTAIAHFGGGMNSIVFFDALAFIGFNLWLNYRIARSI